MKFSAMEIMGREFQGPEVEAMPWAVVVDETEVSGKVTCFLNWLEITVTCGVRFSRT